MYHAKKKTKDLPYCIFPKKSGTVKSLGKFDVKYEKGERYNICFSIRYDGGKWHTQKRYVWENESPHEVMAGGAVKMRNREPCYSVLHDGRRPIESRQKAFREAVNKDFQAWKKKKAEAKEKKLKKEADKLGIDVETHKENVETRARNVLSVEATKLKIEILTHMEKQRLLLVECADSLENNTFTHHDASRLRSMGKSFGSGHYNEGIFPKMRSVAKLIKERS